MIDKRKTIEKMVKTIHECLEDGVVFITHLTDKGQVICFYNLEREPIADKDVAEAIYSFERTGEEIIDYVEFNRDFYSENENKNVKN